MVNSDLLFFCSMCRERSAEEIAKLECVITHSVKHFKKGDHVAYQGSKVTHLYMLTKGRVRSEMVSDSGLTLQMEEIEAPYPLAAAFLFADNNRFPVDVIAMESCELLLISKESIEKQMALCPGFLRGFISFNANRMQYLSERLKVFAQKGIKAKMAYHILSMEQHGSFELDRSVVALSEYFGVARPSLSRAISEMVRDEIITFDSGRGRVIDYKSLHELLG